MLATAWLVARKDLVIEFRTRSAFLAALVFALLAVVIFRFSWDPTAVAAIDLAPGVLWVIFVFSGLLGLHRSFGVEQADRAMDGLLAAPVSREALFLGKALANLLFVAGVTTGTKNGSASIGSSSSARRVFTGIALNSVPTATRPTAAIAATSRMPASTPPPTGRS